MRGFDWSQWSIGARLSFGLAIIGVPIFVVLPPLVLGQSWPIMVGPLLLGLYVFVYARDARRRGVYRTVEYGHRLKQQLVGTAFGLLLVAIFFFFKLR